MNRRRRMAWIVLWAVMMACLAPATAGAENLDIKGDSYILMDADSGQVLLAHNEHKELPPASMTKLMTLLLAVQDLQAEKATLQDKVTTSENAWKMGGSQVYLEPGETMTLEDMLLAIAVGSANDACVAVAEHLEGSHEAFVERMNRTAKDLGMLNTHFVNAYGLPAQNHLTSSFDMALLARAALQYPKVLEYTSVKEYQLRDGAFKLFNTNKLLWWYQGADGFKTGWTNEAKYCLTATAKRDGLRLIAVTMGSPEVQGNFRDCMRLFNVGYAKYAYKSFFGPGSVCGMVNVGKGNADLMEVVAAQEVGCICAKGEEKSLTYQTILPEYANAPIDQGQVMGEIQIFKNQMFVKKVDLVSPEAIPKAGLIKEIGKMLTRIYLIQ